MVDKGGRDSRGSSSRQPRAKYVPQRPTVYALFPSPPLTRESSSWEPGRESREKMGVTGEQEAGGGRGSNNRGAAGGQKTTGGPKKITGLRKQQLLEIPEEGGVSSSLTDDYIKSVPRLQVEWPMEGDEDEEGQGGRRKPRYHLETEVGINGRPKKDLMRSWFASLYNLRR